MEDVLTKETMESIDGVFLDLDLEKEKEAAESSKVKPEFEASVRRFLLHYGVVLDKKGTMEMNKTVDEVSTEETVESTTEEEVPWTRISDD